VPLAAGALAADVLTAGALVAGVDGAAALVVAAGAGADELGEEAAVLLELEQPTKAMDRSVVVPMASRGRVMPNRDRCMEFLSSTPARRRLWSDDPGGPFEFAVVDAYRRRV
jgi:hypothetical protein